MDPRRFLGLLAVLPGLVSVSPPAVAQATDPAPSSTESRAGSATAPQSGSGAGEESVPVVDGEGPSAADQLRAEAGRRFDLGVSYYDDGRYGAALAEFLRTYEITGEWSVLYNLGQVCRALGRNADAVGYFERYLGLGTDEIDANRRAEVFLALDALDPLVGHVRVDIDLDGAHVFVDGIDRGTTPLSHPLLVDPGSHEIEIRDDRLPGGRDRREILLAGGLTETIELAAAIVSPAPPPPLPPPPDDDDSVWTSWWLWTIVGAVVVGGAVTTGILLWPRETAYDAGTVPPIVLGLGSW